MGGNGLAKTIAMVMGELSWRWVTAVVAVLLVGVAVGSTLWADAVVTGAADVTRRIQRDIGTNLVVLPKDTDTAAWWLRRETTGSMPQDAADRLEASGLAGRLVPLVRRVISIDGTDVLLTGVGAERTGGRRPVFAQDVSNNGAVVGATVAQALGLAVGDSIDLPGGPTTVADVLLVQGSIDDTSVFLPLAQAQRRLDLDGRLTEIEALECRCSPDIADPAAHIVDLAAAAVPEAIVIRRTAAAEARRKQRALVESIAEIVGPAGAMAGMLLVGGLAWLNVRERRSECGVLRALGWTRTDILVVLLGRWLCIGVVGAVLGLLFAVLLSDGLEPRWWWALAAAPGAAVLVGLLPALQGASADPVEALRE